MEIWMLEDNVLWAEKAYLAAKKSKYVTKQDLGGYKQQFSKAKHILIRALYARKDTLLAEKSVLIHKLIELSEFHKGTDLIEEIRKVDMIIQVVSRRIHQLKNYKIGDLLCIL